MYRFAPNAQAWVDPLGLTAEVVARGILGAIATDIATPDPSDIAWQKWAAYAVVAGIAGGVLALSESDVCVSLSDKCNESKRNRCRKWGRGTYTQAKVKVQRGQTPKGIVRIDPPHGGAPNAMVHAHSKNGGHII